MPYSPKHSGAMVQGTSGQYGDFELVFPCSKGGFCYYTGDNQRRYTRWMNQLCDGKGDITGIAMIQGNYGTAGNLEVVAVKGKDLVHYWREDTGEKKWHGPFLITRGVQGVPSIVQSGAGVNANFEVVVPRRGGGLLYLQRDNSRNGGFAWSQPQMFGTGDVSGCSLLRPNVGSLRGTLEVVAIHSGSLVHYKRAAGSTVWEYSTTFGNGISGSPGFIQASTGNNTMFEIVAPLASGGLVHFRRLHNSLNSLWTQVATFGEGKYSAVSLVQPNNRDGKMDVVAVKKKGADHYICGPEPDYEWTGPFELPSLARVRLHVKVLWTSSLYTSTPEIAVMMARDMFLNTGIQIEVMSFENLILPDLMVLDLTTPSGDYCKDFFISEEMEQLYEHRNSVGDDEMVAYFVDATIPATGGCATHPRNKPGFVVSGVDSGSAIPYVILHEIGHVLGLGHTKKTDRLMNEDLNNVDLNADVKISAMEMSKMLRSRYVTKPCC
jgi:hypothetical protein